MQVLHGLTRLLVCLLLLLPAHVCATCPSGYQVRITNGAFTFQGDDEFTYDSTPPIIMFVGQTYTFTTADGSLASAPLEFFTSSSSPSPSNLCSLSSKPCNISGTYPLTGTANTAFSILATPGLTNYSITYGSTTQGLSSNSVIILYGTTYGRWVALALGIIIIGWMIFWAVRAYMLTDETRFTDEVRNWWNELGKSTRRPALVLAWLTIIYDFFQFSTFSFIEAVPWYRGAASSSNIIISIGLDLRGLGFFIEYWVLVGIYTLCAIVIVFGMLYLMALKRWWPKNTARIAQHTKNYAIMQIYIELVLFSLLFVICMRTMLNMLSCDYLYGLDGCVIETEIACWQGIHWFYAVVAFLLVMIALPLTYGHYLAKNVKFDPAIKFISRFHVFNVTMKFCVCIIIGQARIVPWAFVSILLVSRLIALAVNVWLQPCLTWQSVNNFNTGAHATEAFFAVMALITLGVDNPNSYATLISALLIAPVVFIIAYAINMRYQGQRHSTLTITLGAIGEVLYSPFRSRRATQSGSSTELFTFRRNNK